MNKQEIKEQSIKKIEEATQQLIANGEKVTGKRISEVSGLSEITVKRYRVSDKSKSSDTKSSDTKDVIQINVSDKIVSHDLEIVSHPKIVSDDLYDTNKSVSPNDSPTDEEINLVRQFYLIDGEEISKKEIMILTNLSSSIVHQSLAIIQEELDKEPIIIEEEKPELIKMNFIKQEEKELINPYTNKPQKNNNSKYLFNI